jgi:hypothetical protein
MNRELLDKILDKCNSACAEPEYCKLVNLFYDFNKSVPKPEKYHDYKFDKKMLINFLYKKILDYSEQAFYNLILGNSEFYKAGIRIIIENYIILLGIINGNKDTWKKYYLQSNASTIKFLEDESNINLNALKKSLQDLIIEKKLSNLDYENKRYDYSWLSTKNKKIRSFRDACDFLEPVAYSDFRYLSSFSHSGSYSFKFLDDEYSFYNTASLHFIYLTKTIDLLNLNCSDKYIKKYDKLLKYFEYLSKNNPFLYLVDV